MSLRLIRAYVPSFGPELELQLRSQPDVSLIDIDDRPDRDIVVVELAVRAEFAEDAVLLLNKHYGSRDDFKVLVTELAAIMPHPDAFQGKNGNGLSPEAQQEVSGEKTATSPINLEELYSKVSTQCSLDWAFATSIVIASLVAATGIVRDSTELVVASMIIAPLLGPNIAMSTAAALGDLRLGIRALAANGVGIVLTIACGVLMGLFFGVPLDAGQVVGRLAIGPLDFVIAASAGSAAALAYTSGAFSSVVGVMIAVALLPPMVLAAMLAGTGNLAMAVPPALLALVNFIGINLTGVAVLFLRNVRPRRFHEQEDAKRAVITSIGAWTLMFVLLAVLIAVFPEYRTFP